MSEPDDRNLWDKPLLRGRRLGGCSEDDLASVRVGRGRVVAADTGAVWFSGRRCLGGSATARIAVIAALLIANPRVAATTLTKARQAGDRARGPTPQGSSRISSPPRVSIPGRWPEPAAPGPRATHRSRLLSIPEPEAVERPNGRSRPTSRDLGHEVLPADGVRGGAGPPRRGPRRGRASGRPQRNRLFVWGR